MATSSNTDTLSSTPSDSPAPAAEAPTPSKRRKRRAPPKPGNTDPSVTSTPIAVSPLLLKQLSDSKKKNGSCLLRAGVRTAAELLAAKRTLDTGKSHNWHNIVEELVIEAFEKASGHRLFSE